MNLFNQYNHKGFTLIETLFAILIFSASLVSLMSIAGRGIAAANTAREQTVAHYLAQEGVEVVRNIRDVSFINGGWDADFTQCIESDPCQIDYQGGVAVPSLIQCSNTTDGCQINEIFDAYTNAVGTPTPYFRKIYVIAGALDPINGGVNEYQVVSKISWKSKGIDRLVTVQTILKKWQ